MKGGDGLALWVYVASTSCGDHMGKKAPQDRKSMRYPTYALAGYWPPRRCSKRDQRVVVVDRRGRVLRRLPKD